MSVHPSRTAAAAAAHSSALSTPISTPPLPSPSQLQLLLVDSDAAVVAKFDAGRKAMGLADEPRFRTACADLCALRSAGVEARIVCNETNHRMNAKGPPLNKRMHRVVPELAGLTAAAHGPSAKPGSAYPVRRPAHVPPPAAAAAAANA